MIVQMELKMTMYLEMKMVINIIIRKMLMIGLHV